MDIKFVITFTWKNEQETKEIEDAVQRLAIGFGATECRVTKTSPSRLDTPALPPLPTPHEQVLEQALEWWDREGNEPFIGAPGWLFKARTLIPKQGEAVDSKGVPEPK
jgi:hypothetical protein